MKKYAALIRKLVDATAEAEVRGEDVADILKERCFNDTDVVRQTLMNAVCDPRFKLYADVVGYWKDEARYALEQLAEQLEKAGSLTAEDAYYMLDNFLTAWLRMTFKEARRPVKSMSTFDMSEKPETGNVKDAINILNELEEESTPLRSMEDPQNGYKSKKVDKSEHEHAVSNETRDGDEELSQRAHSGDGNLPSNGMNLQRLEECYLQKLPNSLVELARRIGRMGEYGSFKTGKFMTAGKSDIAGITVGNDISAILPSELALLAERKTQNVFYHNYTARRLQLFASASQGKSTKKHKDGPVIICVDTSSSMMGEPIMVAKALAAAVAIIAWRRKRDVVMVRYSDTYDYRDLGHNHSSLKVMSRFLNGVSMAGNNEEGMFQWLFKELKPTLPAYETADILCVSDFGWMPLSDSIKEVIEEQKKTGMRFYGLNVNADNPYVSSVSDMPENVYSPMDVCDSVWTYEGGVCKEIK